MLNKAKVVRWHYRAVKHGGTIPDGGQSARQEFPDIDAFARSFGPTLSFSMPAPWSGFGDAAQKAMRALDEDGIKIRKIGDS